MSEIILFIVAVFALFLFIFSLPTIFTDIQILLVTKRVHKVKLIPQPSGVQHQFYEADTWAYEHGFHFTGFYKFSFVAFGVWYNSKASAVMVQYYTGGAPHYDIATFFEDSISLTTSSNADGFLIPDCPGSYSQSFKRLNLDQYLERHIEAERYMKEELGVVFRSCGGNFVWPDPDEHPEEQEKMSWNEMYAEYEETSPDESRNPYAFTQTKRVSKIPPAQAFAKEVLEQAVYGQMNYASSLPLWMFRWPFWLLGRRLAMPGKTIRELIEKEYYTKPQELPFDYKKWYEAYSDSL